MRRETKREDNCPLGQQQMIEGISLKAKSLIRFSIRQNYGFLIRQTAQKEVPECSNFL